MPELPKTPSTMRPLPWEDLEEIAIQKALKEHREKYKWSKNDRCRVFVEDPIEIDTKIP